MKQGLHKDHEVQKGGLGLINRTLHPPVLQGFKVRLQYLIEKNSIFLMIE